ncbi:TPA: hypothetical protein UOA81_001926 [Stenotrophomonas maltophilia]|nr:hypothetical protein [Stenotrophomonas maltophilia]
MDAIEKRARELLAAQIETRQPRVAKMLRVGWLLTDFVPAVQDAVAAIIAALTPAEGYVLVPAEPTEEMIAAAEEAHMPYGDMGFAISAAIGARPEVP